MGCPHLMRIDLQDWDRVAKGEHDKGAKYGIGPFRERERQRAR